jgi:hypothetical protein
VTWVSVLADLNQVIHRPGGGHVQQPLALSDGFRPLA